MAEENLGVLYNTKVPSFSSPADIQAAFKIYHYGSATYDVNNADPSQLPNPSLARHLATLQAQITTLDESGIGSEFSSNLPSTTDGGFIWMDADSETGGNIIYSTALYTNEQPTENLADGMIWVDKDSALKETYIWDALAQAWIRVNDFATVVENKGDLLVGTGGSNLDNFAVGQDGYVLTARASSPTGLAWEQVSIESFEISSIMGVY